MYKFSFYFEKGTINSPIMANYTSRAFKCIQINVAKSVRRSLKLSPNEIKAPFSGKEKYKLAINTSERKIQQVKWKSFLLCESRAKVNTKSANETFDVNVQKFRSLLQCVWKWFCIFIFFFFSRLAHIFGKCASVFFVRKSFIQNVNDLWSFEILELEIWWKMW